MEKNNTIIIKRVKKMLFNKQIIFAVFLVE